MEKGFFYIENYIRCTDNTNNISKDSRNIVDIATRTGILTEFQQWENSFFGIGLSWTRNDWHQNALYKFVSVQANPSDNIMGLSTGLITQNIILYGAGASVYTDFDEVQIGLQPYIGVTGKAFGSFGENIQLHYSFIFPFLGDRISEVSNSNITLRINFPVKKSTRKEKRIDISVP